MTQAQPILLYGTRLSGHSHRAELMLNLLALPYAFHPVDLARGDQRTPEFLAMSPFGTVPVLDDNGVILADSVAILVYLASRYDADRRWLPVDPVAAATVQFWLSVAQGPIYNGPCAARLIRRFAAPLDQGRAIAVADTLLDMLDRHLARHPFLVGTAPTIADIAAYSYLAVAPEGGIDLAPHRDIASWFGRIEALPGFLPMPGRGA